ELPQRAAEPLPLEVQLRPAAPPPPVVVRPRPRPRPRAAPTPAPIVPAPIVTAPPQIAAAPIFEPAPPAAYEPVEAGAAVVATAEVETPPLAPPAAEASRPDPKPVPVLARRLPRKGEITYELYFGNDKFSVGRTLQTWELDDGSYRLSSVSETTGLVALFSRQRLAYESRGQLTARGLRPEHFTTHRVRSGRSENAAADLDWNAMTAMIGNPQRDVALPADAQDLVSFMYQLGLMPLAPGRIELPITNGWKLERYELEIGGEEQLQTPFGTLRAVPVRQVRRPDRESIELWLAAEYRWLPVRIRFFDREGEPSGEQLVSDIRVSAD
ncbi:MAG: DUF3108 domain-containing protein, partial [Pseudomonadota bacterium]